MGLKRIVGMARVYQSRRAMDPIFGAITQNHLKHYQALDEFVGRNALEFLVTKWPGLGLPDPRSKIPRTTSVRPRSTEEVAERLGVTVDQANEIDRTILDGLVGFVERMSETWRSSFDWLTVPLDSAQGWWDDNESELNWPNGDHKWKCDQCGHLNRVPIEKMGGYRKLPCSQCGFDLRSSVFDSFK